jgi:hypothetical protein
MVESHPQNKEPHEFKLLHDPEAREAKFSKFWWNQLSGLTFWEEPEWDVEWENRCKRSTAAEDPTGDWQKMHDGAIDEFFWVNKKFSQIQWKSPY